MNNQKLYPVGCTPKGKIARLLYTALRKNKLPGSFHLTPTQDYLLQSEQNSTCQYTHLDLKLSLKIPNNQPHPLFLTNYFVSASGATRVFRVGYQICSSHRGHLEVVTSKTKHKG